MRRLACLVGLALFAATLPAQQPAELKGHTALVYSVAFSPDGKMLASGSQDKSVRFWNPGDGKEVKKLGDHANSVYCVTFSRDGKWLASAGADKMVKLWDVAAQKEV